VGAAGCMSQSSPILPAEASFDGHTLGSGSGVPQTPPETESTTSADAGGHTLGSGAGVPQTPPETESTTFADTTGRGGHTLGSGS
jgi:hypothetical protein